MSRACADPVRIAKLPIDAGLFCYPFGTEVACGDPCDGSHFLCGRWIQSQMRDAPPPREDLFDPVGVEVLVSLSERDVELGFEIGKFVG